MNANLFIRFKGVDLDNDSEVDLAELGESLIGFDSLLKEFARILRIQGELEVKATAQHDGSIIVDIVAWLSDPTAGLPFTSVDDFLTFLKLAGDPAWKEACAFFLSLEGVHRQLNDWVSKHPADFALLSAAFAKAVLILWKKARKNKEKPDYSDKDLSKRIVEELHKLIRKRGFRKVLKPIVEDKAESIELGLDRRFSTSATVDQKNFQDYLAEDEQILPHLENGMLCTLEGKITSLKGTRGDSLTFHLEHEGDTYNLDVLPAEGSSSKSYRDFYQERVRVKAEVSRTSLYKKPKLKLQQIDLLQPELGLLPSPAKKTE